MLCFNSTQSSSKYVINSWHCYIPSVHIHSMLSLHTFVFGIFSYLGRPVSFKVPAATMEDTDKEGGPEGQAEKSQHSRDRCYDWLINVALLSNGINIVSVFIIIYFLLENLNCIASVVFV